MNTIHKYKVLDKEEIADFAKELLSLPSDTARNRLVMLEVIYGSWQRNRIETLFFKKVRNEEKKR